MGSISAFIWKKYSSHIIQLITFDIGNKTLKKDNTCNEIRYSLHVYYYFFFYKSYSIPENSSIFAQIIF